MGNLKKIFYFLDKWRVEKTSSYITLQKNRLFGKIKDVTLSKKREEI